MIEFSQRLTVPDDVLMQEVAGEAVLLNLNTETYFGLDAVGTDMWRALTAAATIQQAYDQLLTEYAVDPDTLRADLSRFIEELTASGLVVIAAP